MDYTGTLEGTDTEGFGLDFGDIGPGADFDAGIGAQISPVLGNDITIAHWPEGSPTFTRNPQSGFGEKIGATFDMASNTLLASNGGSTVPGWTASPPIDFSTLGIVGFSMGPSKSSDGDAVLFPSWPRLTVYPPVVDQSELNAMTLGSSGVAIPPYSGGGGLDFTTGILPEGVSLARASAATYFDNTGVLQTAGSDVPRYDFTPTTHLPRGLLIEPAATNLWSDSAAVSSLSVAGAAFTANAGTAPSGTATADKLFEDGSGDRHIAYASLSTINGTIYTLSLAMKPAGRNFAALNFSDAGGLVRYGAAFDLSAGTTGATNTAGTTPANTSARIERSANGFYRAAITMRAESGGTYISPGVSDSAAPAWSLASPTYLGDGTSGVLLADLQLEVGSMPTSFIPTSGGTATRAADYLTIPVPVGMTTAHCTIEGGSVDIAVTAGPVTLSAADFGGPVHLHGITFS